MAVDNFEFQKTPGKQHIKLRGNKREKRLVHSLLQANLKLLLSEIFLYVENGV